MGSKENPWVKVALVVGAVVSALGGTSQFVETLRYWIGGSLVGIGAWTAGLVLFFGISIVLASKVEPAPKRRVWLVVVCLPAFVCFFLAGIWMDRTFRDAPGNLVKFFDFETSSAGWEDVLRYDLGLQTQKWAEVKDSVKLLRRPGRRGIAYELDVHADRRVEYYVRYDEPVQADIVSAEFYLPKMPQAYSGVVGIVAFDKTTNEWLASAEIHDVSLGEWRELVLDLRGQYKNDKPINQHAVWIQVFYYLTGSSDFQSTKVMVRLDHIAFYKGTGIHSIREERGKGHVLIDFEDGSHDQWWGSDDEEKKRIKPSYDVVFRGLSALKWELTLEEGKKKWLKTKQQGLPVSGIWIARVHMSPGPGSGAALWCQLFSYVGPEQQDWEDSPNINLHEGWNTVRWDTHQLDWGATDEFIVGIEIGAEGESYDGLLHIDDIHLFELPAKPESGTS